MTSLPDSIPIVADVPQDDPRLGFENYATAIAAAIRGAEPAQLTFGVYGDWGSGKSSLLNGIAMRLAGDPTVIVVRFDAWRYESEPNIIVPLMQRVYDSMPDSEDVGGVKAAISGVLLAALRSVTLTLGPLQVDPFVGMKGPDQENASNENALASLAAIYSQVMRTMEVVSRSLDGRRIVVMVDDLDRCSPERIVSMLEAINLLMDVPGFVFVLALDYNVMVRALDVEYDYLNEKESTGERFIEKMVQVPIRVPRLNVSENSFINDILTIGAGAVMIPPALNAAAFEVFESAAQHNPRKAKRLINSVLTLLGVANAAGTTVPVRLLAGVVGLQLFWSAEYQDFVVSVFSDDREPLDVLRRSEDLAMGSYLAKLFMPAPSKRELRRVLDLARAVETPGVGMDDTAPSAAVGDRAVEGRSRVEQKLSECGFELDSEKPDVYRKVGLDDIRLTFGKTVIRIEGYIHGRWRLLNSYPLSNPWEAIELVGKEASLQELLAHEMAYY